MRAGYAHVQGDKNDGVSDINEQQKVAQAPITYAVQCGPSGLKTAYLINNDAISQ